MQNALVLGRQDYHWRHEPIFYGWKPGAAHRFYGDRKQTTVIESNDGLSIEPTANGQRLTITWLGRTVVLEVPSYKVVLDEDDEMESVWRFDKPSKNTEHPTMKPVKLCARAIMHGSRPGEIVLDSFLGSGSALIACEQLGRKCYGTELDPRYCDVIVKRWEQMTGKTPRVHSLGR